MVTYITKNPHDENLCSYWRVDYKSISNGMGEEFIILIKGHKVAYIINSIFKTCAHVLCAHVFVWQSLSHVSLWPLGYTVHGILQARILEWVAVPFSKRSPQPGIKARSPILQADSLSGEPAEKPKKPKNTGVGSLPPSPADFPNPKTLFKEYLLDLYNLSVKTGTQNNKVNGNRTTPIKKKRIFWE